MASPRVALGQRAEPEAGSHLKSVMAEQLTSCQAPAPKASQRSSPGARASASYVPATGLKWGHEAVLRARGLINHDSAELGAPLDAAWLRPRGKALERGGPLTFAKPSAMDRLVAAGLDAASPRERPDPDAQAKATATAARDGLSAAFWKGGTFTVSKPPAPTPAADAVLFLRHRTPFVDSIVQRHARERNLDKEILPAMSRASRVRTNSAYVSPRQHRTEIDALSSEFDSYGLCERDVTMERSLISTGMPVHLRKRPATHLYP